jgi:MoaA/NifB/PqqE/SkfB family radical SAM enzyme
MKPSRLVRAARDAVRIRFLGARIPLAARLQVTRACPSRCRYCHPPAQTRRALDVEQFERILVELADLGCLRVSFSGGEPMLHPAIGRLVRRCAELGMDPEMNSSGAGFVERAAAVGRLKLLKLSLDGPREVHDAQRGRAGSYDEVVRSARTAHAMGIRTVLVATVTSGNIDHVEHVVRIAREVGAFAAVQPLKPYYKGCADVESLVADGTAIRKTFSGIREAVQRGELRHLRNSVVGLRHIERWPDLDEIRCWAGRIFCVVGTDGTLYPCDRTRIDVPLPNAADLGLRAAIERLPDPDCAGCGFCGALELNLLMSLDLRILWNVLRLVG